MLTAVLGWLGSKGVSLLLGYAFGFLMDVINSRQAAEAQRDAGRNEVEAAQAEQGLDMERELADEAAKTVTEDDAIARLGKGEA